MQNSAKMRFALRRLPHVCLYTLRQIVLAQSRIFASILHRSYMNILNEVRLLQIRQFQNAKTGGSTPQFFLRQKNRLERITHTRLNNVHHWRFTTEYV